MLQVPEMAEPEIRAVAQRACPGLVLLCRHGIDQVWAVQVDDLHDLGLVGFHWDHESRRARGPCILFGFKNIRWIAPFAWPVFTRLRLSARRRTSP